MIPYRAPTENEKRLIVALMQRSKCPAAFLEHLNTLLVQDMDDGGMGSLRFFLPARPDASRAMKSQASELQFTDADGGAVIVSLYVSEDGLPLEVDVWKPNFSPLIRVADEFFDVIYGKNPDSSN